MGLRFKNSGERLKRREFSRKILQGSVEGLNDIDEYENCMFCFVGFFSNIQQFGFEFIKEECLGLFSCWRLVNVVNRKIIEYESLGLQQLYIVVE